MRNKKSTNTFIETHKGINIYLCNNKGRFFYTFNNDDIWENKKFESQNLLKLKRTINNPNYSAVEKISFKISRLKDLEKLIGYVSDLLPNDNTKNIVIINEKGTEELVNKTKIIQNIININKKRKDLINKLLN